MVVPSPKPPMKTKRALFAAATATLLGLVILAAAAFLILRNRSTDQTELAPLPDGTAPQALRLTVTQSGIAVVTAEQLAQASLLSGELEPDAVQLSRDGQSVPFLVQDDALYFYAQAITRSLETAAVYWLEPGNGTTIAAASAEATGTGTDSGRITHIWEENNTFVSLALSEDVWFGHLLNAGESIEVALTDIQPAPEDAALTVRVWSNNEAVEDPDHHLVLAVNGEQVGEHWWDGKKQETITATISGELLQPEGNVLTVSVPGDTGALGEQIYLDWVRLDYVRPLDLAAGAVVFSSDAPVVRLENGDESTLLFDVTQPDAPVQLTGLSTSENAVLFANGDEKAQYAAANPANAIQPLISVAPVWETPLQAEDAGADYVALYANQDGFLETLQPLLDYRASQDMTVRAVDVAQVYDEFSHGRPTPEGMRAFLLYAAANWEPAPRFALLVGDASYDFNNFTEGKNQNILLTQLVYTDFMGYVASDTWFVIPPDSSLSPQMAIGRFPAQTAEQLETMVAKTLLYERDQDPSWSFRALLVADDEPYFDTSSDQLAENLNETGFNPEKLYMSQNEDIHEDIMTAINDGVGLVNYVGHGSVEVWGDERVLRAEDAASLRNRGRFPIFTTFTCLNGYFNHPDVDALAETLLTAPNGGVVAAIAPSSRTTTFQQFQVADIFFDELLNGKVRTLGEALQIAKQENADNTTTRDVIYSYNLLGDPALHFHLPQ